MRVLGFEGTAHTCGVGIVEVDPADADRCLVLANRAAMLRPDEGGIHPREAADHHVEVLPALLGGALEDAGLRPRDLDGVAFSQGPGLGPCLRTVATAARALALRHDLPLAGVNHCVAHLEIGRATTGARDPVMLYASGANTQVIAEAAGRYRVFGETLDVGIGNALDKFAREHGMPFPGGPRIEELARTGRADRHAKGAPLPMLPYSVKGMDVTFSGTIKATSRLIEQGLSLEEACDALQEWAFAMLVEVTERALAHTERDEVLLGGGVGRNRRLQAMLQEMAEARGARFFCPEPALLSDNGAMIAWNGLLVLRAGRPTPVAESLVDQKQRTDDVDLVWREASDFRFGPSGLPTDAANGNADLIARGAEAEVRRVNFAGRPAVLKARTPKTYRDPAIESALVAQRVRRETRHTTEAARAGARVPRVWDADPVAGTLLLEEVQGPALKRWLGEPGHTSEARQALLETLGAMVGRLHHEGLVHGDLTTSNVLVEGDTRPVLLDFGLAERTLEPEPRAVDLHVLQEALEATHTGGETPAALWKAFEQGYRAAFDDADRILSQLDALRARGRYMGAHQ